MPRNILFVEDDRAQAGLIVEACRLAEIHHAHFVDNSAAARDYLLGLASSGWRKSIAAGNFCRSQYACDGGTGISQWLRSHPRLEHIPVFILTASENPADMQLAQELGSTAHFEKPLELRELAELFFE